eukprot:11315212-Alexandrium_andersonii.AAC.1
MSASLVGSEMCIRDRRLEARLRHTNGAATEYVEQAAESAIVATNLPDAVSYTHLTLPTICSV